MGEVNDRINKLPPPVRAAIAERVGIDVQWDDDTNRTMLEGLVSNPDQYRNAIEALVPGFRILFNELLIDVTGKEPPTLASQASAPHGPAEVRIVHETLDEALAKNLRVLDAALKHVVVDRKPFHTLPMEATALVNSDFLVATTDDGKGIDMKRTEALYRARAAYGHKIYNEMPLAGGGLVKEVANLFPVPSDPYTGKAITGLENHADLLDEIRQLEIPVEGETPKDAEKRKELRMLLQYHALINRNRSENVGTTTDFAHNHILHHDGRRNSELSELLNRWKLVKADEFEMARLRASMYTTPNAGKRRASRYESHTHTAPDVQVPQELSDEIARVFWDSEQANVLCIRAGFPVANLPHFRDPTSFWVQVIQEIANGRAANVTMNVLCRAAQRQYPGNAIFRKHTK